MKKEIMLAACAIGVLCFLTWDWSHIKSFISGGVLAVWLMQRFCNA